MINKNWLLIVLSLVSLQFALAQGTIRGTIIDDVTGETVPFANVLVVETQSGTTSDLDGTYSLPLSPGTYTLEFTFLGYSKTTVSDILVEEGKVNLLDIRLEEESELLEEVVVTAKQIRTTEAAILTIQKKSPNLLDGISSQTFKKIGDSDAASAIKRVTGVSVQGGKYVFVRGLGDRYTKSILNGMDIPGLDPDRNTLQMDIFPTNLIDNIIVLKSFTPDLPGDFTGGVVDIITKDFPEEKTINASIGMGFNPGMHLNSEALTQNSSSTDWLGFDNGQRNIPFPTITDIPLPAERNPFLSIVTEEFSNDWAVSRNSFLPDMSASFSAGNQINKEKVTYGYNVALNYKNSHTYNEGVEYNIFLKPRTSEEFELRPNRLQKGDLGTNDVLLTGLIGGAMKIKNHKFSLSAMRINNGTSRAGFFNQESFISATNTIQRDNLEYSERSITNALLKGKHSFEDAGFTIDWKLSPTISEISDKDVRAAPFRTEEGSSGTTFTIEPSEGAAPIRIWRDLREINYSGKLDLTKELQFAQRDAKLQAGLSGVTKNREYGIINYQFDIQGADNIVFSGDANEVLLPQNIWDADTRTGVYAFGNPEPANSFDATQTTIGAYLMGEIPFTEKLKAIGGVRIENFTHNYTGQNNSGSLIFDNEELLNNTNFLPALNLVYSADDNTNLRMSFSQTLARPSFKELSLAQIYDAITDRFFIGNIDLVQTDIRNYDARIERFLPGGQMFAISGFYKQFDNPIEIVAFSDAAPADITPRNVGNAEVLGIELEIRKNLDFINKNWSNLNIGSNITIVQSSVDLDLSEGGEYESRLRNAREGETVGTTRDMQGQSPYILNGFLSYSNLENGWDANLSYNVQGKSLAVVGIATNPDVYQQPFHSLNLKVSKKFGEDQNTSISISANNLLGAERLQEYESFGTENAVYSKIAPGAAFSFGLSRKF